MNANGFDKIIHWFAPEGQDVMELYATDETTGEKTQIHSYDGCSMDKGSSKTGGGNE